MTSGSGSGCEGLSTPAGCARVRVADDELRTLQVFLVVNFCAHQILDAHRIDDKRDTLVDDLAVAVLNVLIERETVLEARATAT